MNKEQQYYLQAIGIPVWTLRQSGLDLTSASQDDSVSLPVRLSSWDSLQTTVAHCTACQLSCSRTQTVFGVGHKHAELMIVGEAPGFYEDQQGEPFVGRAGQLLNAMLKSIGLTREQIYIANILKCRPPNNRDPLPEEVASCTPFLNQQIELLQPRLMLAVGRIAAHYLLNTKTSLSQLRGKWHQYQPTQTPLLVTYHPAYLLRNPLDKGRAYQDLLLMVEKLSSC